MIWSIAGMNTGGGVTMWQEFLEVETTQEILDLLPGFMEKYHMISIVGDKKLMIQKKEIRSI